MFDLKNLDNLFNDSSLNKRVNANEAVLFRYRKAMRFIKIGFPAAAAALIGLLVIFPSLQERGEFTVQISRPTRQELEKLHMENTVLYITDKNNRVNSFTAENIDETNLGSQLVKISRPKGQIPTSDSAWIDITAPFGFYDQKTKLLSFMEDVKAEYSDGMTAHTEEMYYDSQKAKAYGSKEITISGQQGHLQSQGFEYYTGKELAVFTGKTDIKTAAGTFGEQTNIYADKKVEFYRKEQKLVAVGNAVMTRTGIKVNGDVLTAVFAENAAGKNEIKDFQGDGNVSIDNGKNKVYADQLRTFFQKDKNTVIDRIEMTGHVKTKTADGEVYADMGIYYPQSGDVKLKNNIVIIKNGNKIQGTGAETNLNTGITKISAGTKNRVSGVFYEDSLQKSK